MTLNQARDADRQDRPQEAADLYEEVIQREPGSRDAMLDLALLYWEATDFGYQASRRLPQAFVDRAGRRFTELLAQARQAFPEDAEIEFWYRYVPWAHLGEPFPVEDCQRLFARDPSNLAPVLYLFAQDSSETYQAEAVGLLRQSKDKGTLGARYVQSVLEGIFTRKYRHQPPFPEIGD